MVLEGHSGSGIYSPYKLIGSPVMVLACWQKNMRDEGLNHYSHSKQDVCHFMPTPKLPWSQGGDAKEFRGISCTLDLLGSLGTLSLGNARLLRQTCSLPFRAAWPYPSRLLTADMILGDDPRKEQSGLSILCRDTGSGPMVGYHSQEFPRYFRVSHQ